MVPFSPAPSIIKPKSPGRFAADSIWLVAMRIWTTVFLSNSSSAQPSFQHLFAVLNRLLLKGLLIRQIFVIGVFDAVMIISPQARLHFGIAIVAFIPRSAFETVSCLLQLLRTRDECHHCEGLLRLELFRSPLLVLVVGRRYYAIPEVAGCRPVSVAAQ